MARKNNKTIKYDVMSFRVIAIHILAPKHIVTNINDSNIIILFKFPII